MLRSLLIIPLLALALTGCGADTTGDDEDGVGSTTFNVADIAFVTTMIPHHEQAVEMVDLADGRNLSPRLVTMMEQIRDAQEPEIATMSDWLTAWGQPLPDPKKGHAHTMDGMMTPAQMKALKTARGAQFERMWISMMISHHEGAVEMAALHVEQGANAEVRALAEEMAVTQQVEIDDLKAMLAR